MASSAATECTAVPVINDERCELWTNRFDGGGGYDFALTSSSLALAPAGDRAYVTGVSQGSAATAENFDWDYATVAWDTASGERLWTSRHSGGSDGTEVAMATTVSPDGALVYVTGQSGSSFHTIAYAAGAGTIVWEKGTIEVGTPYDVTAAQDGTAIFVTGAAGGDVLTVAYDAHTGQQLWKARLDSRGGSDGGFTITSSPCQATQGPRECVYVGGWAQEGPDSTAGDYLALAYDGQTGDRLWKTLYSGGADDLRDLVVAPASNQILLTGGSQPFSATRRDLTTVALDAASGAVNWVSRHDDNPSGVEYSLNVGYALALDPDGKRAYVTGQNYTFENATHAVTLAYDLSDGEILWSDRYDGIDGAWSDPTTELGLYTNQLGDSGYAITSSPDGERVYVASCSMFSPGTPGAWGGGDTVTFAYDASSGDRVWEARYAGSRYTGSDQPTSYVAPDCPNSIAVHPVDGRLFVSGTVSDASDDAAIASRGWSSLVDADFSLVAYAP